MGETSLGSRLGGYYLDFREIIPVILHEVHGPLDAQGVPLTRVGKALALHNTITIAQYALALHDVIQQDGRSDLRSTLTRQLDTLVAQPDHEGTWAGFSVHRWDNLKYPELKAPWVSALSQGNAISALLRGHQLLGEDRFLDCAREMFAALNLSVSAGGVRLVDPCGHLWFEEYPMDPPCHVLNGFIFALWGVLDFARATESGQAWDWWERGLATLRAHLTDFDCGYWSIYDLRYRELASVYYHCNVHIPQMDALYALTHEARFQQQAERWRRFGRSPLRRARQWLWLRIEARRRGYRFG